MKIAVLFPGYGSQFVGMGKELYDSSRIMQEYFEEASNCLNVNFVKLCFASSDAEISKLEHALVANFLVSSSLYAIAKERGLKPDVVLGHDVGQYSAIYAAGGISFPDMLYLLQKYTKSYQDVLNRMGAKAIKITGMKTETLKSIVQTYEKLNEPAFITVYEKDMEHVVAGYASSIHLIKTQALLAGAKKVIDLSYVDGLHSILMQDVEQHIKLYSTKVDFKDLAFPLMTTTKAAYITTKEEVKSALLESIVEPVRWADCVEQLVHYDVIIQIGPGKELANTLQKIYPDKRIASINKESDLSMLDGLSLSDSNEGKQNT
jgi:[acyl-carrier-protein] S-malonyltransferase